MAVREYSETWTKVHGNILDQYVEVGTMLGTRPYLVMLPTADAPRPRSWAAVRVSCYTSIATPSIVVCIRSNRGLDVECLSVQMFMHAAYCPSQHMHVINHPKACNSARKICGHSAFYVIKTPRWPPASTICTLSIRTTIFY